MIKRDLLEGDRTDYSTTINRTICKVCNRIKGKNRQHLISVILVSKLMLFFFPCWGCKKTKLTKTGQLCPVSHIWLFLRQWMHLSCIILIKTIWISYSIHQDLKSHFPPDPPLRLIITVPTVHRPFSINASWSDTKLLSRKVTIHIHQDWKKI